MEYSNLNKISVLKNGKKAKVNSRGKYKLYGANGCIGYTDDFNLPAKSIIIGRVGANCGSVHFTEVPIWISDNTIGVIPSEKVDNYFLYYLLKSLRLNERSSGSAQPLLNQGIINSIELKLVDLCEQIKIGNLLKDLDSKINTTNKIIDNLEQISQTLFKRWFIDFEFPNEEGQPYKSSGGKMIESELGEIPEGWEIKKLGTIVSNKREKYKKEEKLPYVPINELPMKKMLFYNFLPAEQAKSSLIKFNKNDILIGNMRVYFHRVCLAPFEGVTRTTTFVLKPLTSLFRNYILLNLFTEKFVDFANQTSKGTTIPYAVWENGCENFKVIFPNDESILKKFNDVVDETILKSLLLLEEIDKLEQLRDTLLPKLLSGEIEIPDDLEV